MDWKQISCSIEKVSKTTRGITYPPVEEHQNNMSRGKD